MNLCDDLAETIKLYIQTNEKNNNKIKNNLENILFYLCFEKDVDYFKYGFPEPTVPIEKNNNAMSKKEIEALMKALDTDYSDQYY